MATFSRKDASFSVRMSPEERDMLDDIAIAHDRPRSWVVRKFVRLFANLEKANADGALNASEAAALATMKKGLADPFLLAEAEEDE